MVVVEQPDDGATAEWREYRRLLLAELRRLSDASEKQGHDLVVLREVDILAIKIELATQSYARKVNAAVIGAMTGFMTSVIIALIAAVIRHWIP